MDIHASLAPAKGAANPVPSAAAGRRAAAVNAANSATLETVSLEFNPVLWRLDGNAEALIAGLWPQLAPEVDGLLDDFYRFMGGFPENGAYFADRGKVDCLKLLQKEHLEVFFKGRFDANFLKRVHAIGAAHARVSLPPRYLFAGYAFLMERLVRSAIHHGRRRPEDAAARAGAVIRGLMLEAYISSEVYTQTTHNEQMLNAMQGLAESFEQELDQAVEFVRRSAGSMEEAAEVVLAASSRVSGDSSAATDASDQANSNAQTIAAAAEELSASIAEISRQVEHSTLAANEAATHSRGARSLAENLAAVSERIGSIVKLIERISKETRLLALNANIEAARAGDAGRGFAVVATEVKNLADQTTRATGEIRTEIEAMQAVIRNTGTAIGDVAAKVEVATGNISGIAGAVTEQEAVTREIAQSAGMTAASIQAVHERITSVAMDAAASSRETTKLRQETHGMVDQVIGIKRRVIATLRNSRFADRRSEGRQAVDVAAVCTVDGKSWPCRTDNLSLGGVQLRAPDLCATLTRERMPVVVDITDIGKFQGVVVSYELGALHIQFQNMDVELERRLGDVVDKARREDQEMVTLAKETAAHISRLFEEAIDRKEITWEQLWDVDYRIIKDSEPAQYTTRFLALCDRILPPIQEPILGKNANIAFNAAVDRNGYLPTHNLKYSQPQRPGDKAWNTANCRNRRIFDDRTGLSAARNRLPVLVQTYRRDMGGGQFVSMKDISAPILVHGQHWGGFRIGCRF